jgi:hypothetical protein
MDVQWTKNKYDDHGNQLLIRKSLSEEKLIENTKNRVVSKK